MSLKKVYVTTVQLLICLPDDQMPQDYLSSLFSESERETVTDWAYLKVGAQFLYPTVQHVPDPYPEGWAFGAERETNKPIVSSPPIERLLKLVPDLEGRAVRVLRATEDDRLEALCTLLHDIPAFMHREFVEDLLAYWGEGPEDPDCFSVWDVDPN